MKKLLVCVAALGMLFTSCMRDETRLDEGSVVSFKISAPAVSTRAAIEDTYGTGVAADDLHWAIFEADENGAAVGTAIFENVEEGFFADGVLENTFNVRLVKGKKYVGMFWAQANGAPYTVAWPEVTMGDVNSNDEDLDAFFNIHNFSITAGQDTGEQKVELRRPFAQLNVAIPATDLAAAKAAGFELAKTGVTLNVAKSLNLVTGKVGTPEDVTYTLANIPSDVTATLEGTEYQLISFNYVLVDGDAWSTESDEGQELKDVTFNYGTADETLSQTFSNIAIERNHRTYIVGSLLSETVDFRVIILPNWENPYYLHNQEAGAITMVAEQTTTNKAAMGSATLTWNAVEGAEYYGVEYKGEELDKVNPDSSIRTKADEAATTVSYTVPAGTVTEASASFTIKAYNENDKVIARVVTDPVTVFSLANRPEPAVYVADGKLIVENKELNGTEAKKTNYHVNGVLLEAEVYFYKDGATTPTHTAKGTFWETYPNATYPTPAEALAATVIEKKFKNNFAGSYNTWFWDGATTATTTMPAFEKGTYTIKYKAGYYPVINASYDRTPTDRIIVTDPSDILQEMQYREGASDFKLTIVEGTTPEAVAEGYQGAKVTWPAVDGAASYQVFVGATKVADATTNEATVTGLTDANKYKFIVKSLDANGNVIATSVESNEVEIFTLTGVREPEIVWEDGVLVAHKAYDLTALVSKLTVNFVKDGETKYTASYDKDNDTFNIYTGYRDNGRFTKNYFYDFPCSYGTGGLEWESTGTTTAPTFEPGEYTVEYTAEYVLYLNGYWGKGSSSTGYSPAENEEESNRVMFDKADADEKWPDANLLMEGGSLKKITRDGVLADKFVVSDIFEVTASIDEGTVLGRTLWSNGDPWYTGLASKNGMYNSAKIAWNNNSTFDKVVIAYGGKTVEINDGSFSNSTIIKDLQTSPVDFTVTFYNGATKVSEETVSTDVYVLPATDTSAKWVAKASGSGHKIYGTGWNTKQYTTCHVTFNIYEKGSDSPVFDKDVNYKGALGTILAWTMGEKAPNGVCYAGAGNRACHGGDGNNWDEDNLPTGAIKDGEIFTGLDSSKEYVVKYTLKVWPYIYDASNPNNVEPYTNANGETLFNYFFKRMMVSGEAKNYYNAVDLSGEANLTFE